MQIRSVAVLGAGAVGSYIIWGLSSRKDIRLAVIAEGPRAERLKQQGITINGTTCAARRTGQHCRRRWPQHHRDEPDERCGQ